MPTAAIKYALEEKNLVLVYDSNLLFFLFVFDHHRAPIKEEVKHSSSSFCVSFLSPSSLLLTLS